MRKTKNQTVVMNIGTSSMLVILIGLSFAVLAALAISSARSDYRLSEELAQHTTEYYQASDRAREVLADTDGLYKERDKEGNVSFTVPINEHQELAVALHFADNAKEYKVTAWKVVNTGDWEGDMSLPVLQAP